MSKKRQFRKRKPANKSLKRQVKAVRIKLKKQEPEMKSFDTSWSSSFDSTGIVSSLTLIPQALTKYGRVGNEIRLHQLHLQMYLKSSTSGVHNQTARIIIFRDKSPPSASAPAITDVLETSNTWSLLAKENVGKRFVVYYDKMFRMNYSTYSDNTQRQVNVKIPLHGQIQMYSSSTTNTAYNSNVYMLLLGDVSSFGIEYEGRTRLKFKDA